MLQFLLTIHFILAIAIIGLILLQKHDSDGALGSSGGGSASGMLFSVRGQANLLTRSTAILMTIFMINCLGMAKLAKKTQTQGSLIDAVAAENAPIENKAAKTKAPTENAKKSDAKNPAPTEKTEGNAAEATAQEQNNAGPVENNTGPVEDNAKPVEKSQTAPKTQPVDEEAVDTDVVNEPANQQPQNPSNPETPDARR